MPQHSLHSSSVVKSLSWIFKIVLVIAIGVSVRIFLFTMACTRDGTVNIPILGGGGGTRGELSIQPCSVFSETYQQARTRFRKAVQLLGLSWEALDVVPNKDLTMDIAVIPGSQPGLVLHTSGVHGVEGYAGSAIQLSFLGHLYNEQQQRKGQFPDMPTLILVHAVNPSGMSEYRRPNENNVDLNRNAMTDEELQSSAVSHPNHENYVRLDPFFNPDQPPTYLYAYCGLWIQAIHYIWKAGYLALKAAMVGGQYYQPKGIFYGGQTTREPSVRLLEEWVRNFMANRTTDAEEAAAKPSKVTWIDVHTGLGPMGVDSMIARGEVEEVKKWFPGAKPAVVGKSQKDGKDEENDSDPNQVSKGYEQSKGFVVQFIEQRVFAGHDTFVAVEEFGTVPGLLVGHALMLENAAYFAQDFSPEEKLAWAKRTTRRAFYPQSPVWRKQILLRGVTRVFQALKRSAETTTNEKQEDLVGEGTGTTEPEL